ncbi:MAG: hypothetical protein WC570_02555 [Patescibacteria group bacterium]
MKKITQKKIVQMVADYKLWIAGLEQYLIDHRITQAQIINKLNYLKQQLNVITRLDSMFDIHQKISYVENSLNHIQRQLILAPTY